MALRHALLCYPVRGGAVDHAGYYVLKEEFQAGINPFEKARPNFRDVIGVMLPFSEHLRFLIARCLTSGMDPRLNESTHPELLRLHIF